MTLVVGVNDQAGTISFTSFEAHYNKGIIHDILEQFQANTSDCVGRHIELLWAEGFGTRKHTRAFPTKQ